MIAVFYAVVFFCVVCKIRYKKIRHVFLSLFLVFICHFMEKLIDGTD